METPNNKIYIKILNTEMCMTCRFCEIRDIKVDGKVHPAQIVCKRKDCDNWDYSDILRPNLEIVNSEESNGKE